MCQYHLETFSIQCPYENWENSDFCPIHTPLLGRGDVRFMDLSRAKKDLILHKAENKDFNFEGAKLYEFYIENMKGIKLDTERFIHLSFKNSEVETLIDLDHAVINGAIFFDHAVIGTGITLNHTQISGGVWFNDAKVVGNIVIKDATLKKDLIFNKTKVLGNIFIINSKVLGPISLNDGELFGDVSFFKSELYSQFTATGARITGTLILREAIIHLILAQEIAYRIAKKICEDLGNRTESDFYFYREMEAKRKQKKITSRLFELIFIQTIFGYGVMPQKIVTIWALMILSFAILFWLTSALVLMHPMFLDYLYFSITNATTPGYGGMTLKEGFLYKMIASFEAVFGTFMWASLIATFARKYMR
jgi:hypothetical protein